MEKYDLILIGANALALGCAQAVHQKNLRCAVIDSGCVPGGDYALGWRGGAWREGVNYAPETRTLIDEMISRNMADGERVLAPAVGPLAAEWFLKSDAACLMLSRVTGIKAAAEGCLLTVNSTGGDTQLHASRIIDTTAAFDLHSFFQEEAPCGQASLTLLAHGADHADFPQATGLFGETYIAYPLPADCPAAQARLLAWQGFSENPARFGADKLIAMAPDVCFVPNEYGRDITPGILWRPSVRYATVADAFEAGLALAAGETIASLTLPEAEIDEQAYDVIIAGLGTAGSMAALRAARAGLRVLGVEQLGFPGGANTAGSIQGYYYGVKGGIYRQIDVESEEIGKSFTDRHIAYSKAIALHKNFVSAGVETVYDALVCGVQMNEAGDVRGVCYRDASGLHAARARFVIDCTAEGSVCRMAGCDMIKGRALDEKFMAFSSVYMYYDVAKNYMNYGYRDNGVMNQYDPIDAGRWILRAASEDVHLPARYDGEKLYLGIAPLIGNREGERIVGEEIVRFDGYMSGAPCQNPAFYCLTNTDIHNKEHAFEDRLLRDWLTIAGMWGYNLGVPVPPGALIPRGRKGILAAGRIFSADHNFAQGLRMMDDCSKSGEAAADLAILAMKLGVLARDVPYDALRVLLEETGCLKDGDGITVERQRDGSGKRWMHEKNEPWLNDSEAIVRALATEQPGFAMWSARLMGERAVPALLCALDEGDELLKRNAALTLSLIGRNEGAPVLLSMMNDLSGYTPFSSHTYVVPHAVSAISALSRLGIEAAVEPMLEIVERQPCISEEALKHRGFIVDREDMVFQYVSHAAAGVCEIAQAHPDKAPLWLDRLSRAVESPGFSLSVTLMGTKDLRLDMRPSLKRLIASCGGAR